VLQQVARGGAEIGSDTLLTFYTYHTTVLPVLAVSLMAFHFWRVRKAGGVVEPPAEEPREQPADSKTLFFPDLLLREFSQALVVLALVVALGALVGAPIGERANPGMSPNPAKAPWYFMGFQELLIHLHPFFAVLVFPAAMAVGLMALPWLGDDRGPAGRWFLSPSAARAAGLAAVSAVVVTAVGVALDEFLELESAAAGWWLRGVVPTAAFAAITAGLGLGARRRYGLGRNETLQTVVVFVIVTFACLTVVGVWLRGEGMALIPPWGH
jgi:quinol-cytochrome oxidoreductase complex cytochrome b subunit